jgi:Ca2+-transporting ATPase
MEQDPRPPEEPIINRVMRIGIAVQTVAITAATLTAYLLGLKYFPDQPGLPETMAFVTLSFSELLRAFTARSERYPLFKIGFFTNKWMVYAVAASLILLLVVIYAPFLQPIFETVPLGLTHWEIVLPLLVVPSIAAEVTKWFISRASRAGKPI